MKQKLNPIQIVVSIVAFIIVVGTIGFMAISNRPVAGSDQAHSGPPKPAAAQVVGTGATLGAGSYSGPPPAASQVMGAGASASGYITPQQNTSN